MLALVEPAVTHHTYRGVPLREPARSGDAVRALLSRQPLRRLSSDDHLFYEEDDDRNVYRIESGIVALYKILGNGRRQIVSLRFAGDIIGLDAAASHLCSAAAVSPVTARSVTQDMIERLVDRQPEAASEIIDLMAAELSSTRQQIMLLNRRSALEKLAAFILELDRRQAKGPRNGKLVSVPMSRTDIADFLGLTIETVSRNLTKLRLRKIICLPDVHTIAITNHAELSSLADGEMDDD